MAVDPPLQPQSDDVLEQELPQLIDLDEDDLDEDDDPQDEDDNLDDLDPLDRVYEERLRAALLAVERSEREHARGGPRPLSLRQAAKIYDVSRTTLTERRKGRKTRKEAHASEANLSSAQEEMLVSWIKVLGHRRIPMTPTVLRDYASKLALRPVGMVWVRRFLKRHPDVKVRWTTGLESCRAQALNRHAVSGYFDIIYDLIVRYDIPPENIYNMDEKGLLLGIGKRVRALVDRDQKTVNHIEDGNRELVTAIECISADGTALRPTVIYQGARRDLRWGENNPCHASISHSPKGWTDQELGSIWLEKDFEPQSAARNVSGRYRLLILDGHNSHCTYRFCSFAERHGILVVCLPPHTTHALQPCDVAVFAPLASCWKSEVNRAARNHIPITKYNLLEYYHAARERAFKVTTIQVAFMKTGIWPLNRDALPEDIFEPSNNTTTQPAQPVPATVPAPLTLVSPEPVDRPVTPPPCPPSSASSSLTVSSSVPSIPSPTVVVPPRPEYKLVIPSPPRRQAPRRAVLDHCDQLRSLLAVAETQLIKDHAQLQLMEIENGRLRAIAFQKLQKKTRKKELRSGARHLTHEDNLRELAKEEFAAALKEARPVLKRRYDELEKYMRDIAAQKVAEENRLRKAKAAEKRKEEAARKKAEKEEEKRQKANERAAKRAEAAAAKKARAHASAASVDATEVASTDAIAAASADTTAAANTQNADTTAVANAPNADTTTTASAAAGQATHTVKRAKPAPRKVTKAPSLVDEPPVALRRSTRRNMAAMAPGTADL
ncbi:DDE-domain-containing protein [Phanerochaete sordida]|uniref:DDE-domain-containing protein n=1 Tax=Phanerochaete sordida TaxID=48140 RepID=A0A9P3G722_9APHY|nr:DDE-domain-containing protein [Phanerochaete sordida]